MCIQIFNYYSKFHKYERTSDKNKSNLKKYRKQIMATWLIIAKIIITIKTKINKYMATN